MLSKDPELKRQRGYTDPKSFVRNDGSEVLFKADWKQRKAELWERSTGRCEYYTGEWRCTNGATIPAHVIPRALGRDDRLENLKNYCLIHDRIMERQNWRKPRFGEGSKPIVKRRVNAVHEG